MRCPPAPLRFRPAQKKHQIPIYGYPGGVAPMMIAAPAQPVIMVAPPAHDKV